MCLIGSQKMKIKSDEVFHFIINRPRLYAERDGQRQTAYIIAKAPRMVFSFHVDSLQEKNIEYAKSELKMALIEAIMNGTWEFEE